MFFPLLSAEQKCQYSTFPPYLTLISFSHVTFAALYRYPSRQLAR
jgi:hypothetical protein